LEPEPYSSLTSKSPVSTCDPARTSTSTTLPSFSAYTVDSIFIASGRLHAIGAGFLIHEIQQNSDTTYRVFDWNRAGLDGKARELHIDESMQSIDFHDFTPPLAHVETGTVAACEHFRVEKKILTAPQDLRPSGDFALVTIVGGRATCCGQIYQCGEFFLLPANDAPPVSPADGSCTVLVTTIP
jgi:mannose-6-phosphate isomerase